MEIIQTHEGRILNISIIGELDARSSIQLDEVLKEAFETENFKLVVNCESLRYISSAGLGVFISHFENFKQQNGKIVLFNMSAKILQVFEILGLDKVMEIADDREDAGKKFNAG